MKIQYTEHWLFNRMLTYKDIFKPIPVNKFKKIKVHNPPYTQTLRPVQRMAYLTYLKFLIWVQE